MGEEQLRAGKNFTFICPRCKKVTEWNDQGYDESTDIYYCGKCLVDRWIDEWKEMQ